MDNVNFMQTRDLTDEEWLKLPKEEILQLYKNCYKLLIQCYASHQEENKEAIELIEYFVNRVEEGTIRSKITYGKYKTFLEKLKNN